MCVTCGEYVIFVCVCVYVLLYVAMCVCSVAVYMSVHIHVYIYKPTGDGLIYGNEVVFCLLFFKLHCQSLFQADSRLGLFTMFGVILVVVPC